MEVQKYALNAHEAATFLGVSYATILRLCREGSIPYRRAQRRYIFSTKALAQWLDTATAYEAEGLREVAE